MDESFIYERLKALSSGVERSEYRDISKAFQEIVRYNRDALQELEESLRRELRDVSERFYLYGAVAPAGDASIINDFLFPMLPEEEPVEGRLATIFCQCSRAEMEELFESSQEMVVLTEEGTFEITAHIRPCRRFQRKIEELQNVFYDNGVYWRTPHLPYVDRFGDVFCETFQPETPIHSISFKGRDIPVRMDLIPLWNVEPISLKCTIFPVPAIDEWNYRHTLRLPFVQDGYVVRMEQAVKHVYMSQAGLEVISEEKVQRDFSLYRIAVRRDINIPHYPLTSNFRRMRHIDRQADNALFRPRTRAEMARIVTSYEAGENLELLEISQGECGPIGGEDGLCHYSPAGREQFLLKFRARQDGFLLEDQVSFLVQEVQNDYPQFVITGQLMNEPQNSKIPNSPESVNKRMSAAVD